MCGSGLINCTDFASNVDALLKHRTTRAPRAQDDSCMAKGQPPLVRAPHLTGLQRPGRHSSQLAQPRQSELCVAMPVLYRTPASVPRRAPTESHAAAHEGAVVLIALCARTYATCLYTAKCNAE